MPLNLEPPIPDEKLQLLEAWQRQIVQNIAAATCQHYGVAYDALLISRGHQAARRRGVLFYLALEATGLTSYRLAPVFGWNRTGVTYAAEAITTRKRTDKHLAGDIVTIARIAGTPAVEAA